MWVEVLRRVALILGYTLPMLLLFTPGQIPERFLWGWVADHRGVADALLIGACPLLIMLAQWRVAASSAGASGDAIVLLTIEELSEATDNFSTQSEFGRGGFGIVYATSGALRSLAREGRCAVKRLHNSNPTTYDGLRREITLLAKCRHESLLPLLGYCLDQRALCLVYPLLVGGNLDERVHRPTDALERVARLQYPGGGPSSRVEPLGWRERLRAIRDVTRALIHLHVHGQTATCT